MGFQFSIVCNSEQSRVGFFFFLGFPRINFCRGNGWFKGIHIFKILNGPIKVGGSVNSCITMVMRVTFLPTS